jgi:hypothetical protein
VRLDIGRTEEFGLEIVIGEKFVDAPQAQFAKGRGVQMSMNVDERGGSQNLFDS